jgi:hypothetical protein
VFSFRSNLAFMPFDTPEEALLFDIRQALRSFKFAPPPKSHKAATAEWKDRLAAHVLERLQRCWQFQHREPVEMGAGAIIPQPKSGES